MLQDKLHKQHSILLHRQGANEDANALWKAFIDRYNTSTMYIFVLFLEVEQE